MSENLENVSEENVMSDVQGNENVVQGSVPQESTAIIEEDSADAVKTENNQVEALTRLLQVIADKKRELDEEVKQKQDYLNINLGDYNTEEYLQNQDFRNLYSEAFDALGTSLDTKKFVNLLDKYVESRIAIHNKNQAIKSENDNLTDSLILIQVPLKRKQN